MIKYKFGDEVYSEKTQRTRIFVRYADCGLFENTEIWAIENCIAHSNSPVWWNKNEIFKWVIHIDLKTRSIENNQEEIIIFAYPSIDGPDTETWKIRELEAIKRMAIHEVMESFGYDPHELGDCYFWTN